MEVPQLDLVRIVVEAHPSGSRDPIRFPANEELVQMLIRPAERNLQRVMKLGNRAVAAHEQATPNLGTDVAYPDAQLIHLHCSDLCCSCPSSVEIISQQSISASVEEGKQMVLS